MIRADVKLRNEREFRAKLADITAGVKSTGVEAGVLAGTGTHPGSNTPVVDIAIYNEFGTSLNAGRSGGERIVIPARSFIRSTVLDKRRRYKVLIRKVLNKILLRQMTFDAGERRLGMTLQRDIRERIKTLDSPPNAPSTIKKKKSSSPLVDTGYLRQSINWARLGWWR